MSTSLLNKQKINNLATVKAKPKKFERPWKMLQSILDENNTALETLTTVDVQSINIRSQFRHEFFLSAKINNSQFGRKKNRNSVPT